MLERIKHAALRGIRAAGHLLLRLSHPPLVVQLPEGALVGLHAPKAGGEPTAPKAQNSAPDRFAEVDRLLEGITPWSGEVPPGYTVDFLGIFSD